MADGYITIETRLSTDKFDKQITDLEKKLENEEEKEQLKLNAKLQSEGELKRHKRAIVEVEKEYEKTSKQVEHLNNIMSKKASDISLTPQEFTDLQRYKEITALNEKQGTQLDKMYDKQIKLKNAVQKTAIAYKQVQDNVKTYKSKIENIKLNKQQAQVNEVKKEFNELNKSVAGSIKGIGKMAVGIIGVASAYKLMSSASSTLAQYDKQYATNLEYIRYLIAQTIAPALQFVVNLASTLLSYINKIAEAWFNVTLFSKDSAKNFMEAQGSTSKIKKDVQSTPFDEMNVLTDTSAGDTGGAVAPSIDPSMLAGEVPEWLQFLLDHKDEILAVIAGIAAGLIAWKLQFSIIKSLGIGLMIAGIVGAVESLLDYLNDPSWKNFGKLIQWIGIAVLGFGLIIGSVPAIVAGVAILILGIIIKYWNEIKNFLQGGIDWLNEKSEWVHKMFGDTIGDMYDTIVRNIQLVLNWLDNLFISFKYVFDQIIEFVRNVFAGNWKGAWENLKNIVTTVLKATLSTFKTIFKIIINLILSMIETAINFPIRQANNVIKVVTGVFGIRNVQIPTVHLPRLKAGGIINAPRTRYSCRWRYSNRWRSRKRGCNSFNRYTSNGNIRRSNRKIYNNKCIHNKHYEWKSYIQTIETNKQ